MDALLSSRPNEYHKIIKRSLKLYHLSFSKIILLSLLLSIMVFMPSIYFLITGKALYNTYSLHDLRQLWLLVLNLIALLLFIGIIWHMNCVMHKKHEPLIQDIAVGLKKMVYALIATLLQSCIVFACTMIIFGLQILLFQHQLLFVNHLIGIILTGIVFIVQLVLVAYIATLFIFLIPLIAVENKGILGALERSSKLVWNHWWRVFSVQITPWICYAFLLVIIKYVLGINTYLYYFASSRINEVGTVMIDFFIFALFIPWVAALLLIQLRDLEIREKLQQIK